MYQLYVNVLVIGTNCKYKLNEKPYQRLFKGKQWLPNSKKGFRSSMTYLRVKMTANFKHIGYESVPKTVPRITSSSSLKTGGATALQIY